MNKASLLSISLMSFFSSFSQVGSTAYSIMLKTLLSNSVKQISVEEVSNKEFYFLDARAENEYQVSHIRGATWVGYEEFNLEKVSKQNKTDPIVIYCSVGYRSEKIGEKLIEAGFTNVSNLYGGIFEWVNQGNTIVNKKGEKTPNIHAYSKTWGIWLTQGVKVY